MKKLFIFVVALVLLCSTLVSCDTPYLILYKADAALEEAPYVMTVKMSFESDNKDMNDLFSAMNIEIPITVDGKNIGIDMNMDMMGYTANAKVTVVDMVMYYDMEILGQNIKMKATMDKDQYQDFLNENNTKPMINTESLGKLTIESKNGKKYIICDEIGDDGIKALNDMVEKSLQPLGASAAIDDILYQVTISNDKYEAMDMTCTYFITAAGETCTATLRMSTEFSYDNVAKITAPADADNYQETSFENLMS